MTFGVRRLIAAFVSRIAAEVKVFSMRDTRCRYG